MLLAFCLYMSLIIYIYIDISLGIFNHKTHLTFSLFEQRKINRTKLDTAVVKIHQRKKDCKDQDTIRSSTTPDPGYHMR